MKYQHIFIFLFFFILLSCESIFHEPEISIASIENREQLIEAAEGCWAQFIWALNFPDHTSYYYQNLKADDVTYRGTSYRSYYEKELECHPGYGSDLIFEYNKHSDYLYGSLYMVIASINNVLSQTPDIKPADELTKQIVGEMLLLRAYCYFRLTRTYGQILIVKNIEVNFNLSKPSLTQIYEFIEGDLKQAISFMPLTAELARNPGKRPGKGAAKALLAEVYLSWAGYPIKDDEKYANAAKEAEELMDSADFYGIELLADFAYLWDAEHTINRESLFTLYFPDLENVGSVDEINRIYMEEAKKHMFLTYFYVHPYYFDRGTNVAYYGNLEPTFYAAELNFFNHYPKGYRKEITFFTNIYVPARHWEEGLDTGYFHIDSVISICDRAGYRKFYYEESLHAGGMDMSTLPDTSGFINIYNKPIGDNKIYLYRYAHTLLTYAEAKARSGQLDALAYEAVNRIRRRAHNVDQFSPSVYDLTTGLSPVVFADSVVWERAWELAGEPEGRYFDLLRLEKLEELDQYRHPNENSPPWKTITHDEYFLSIPEQDISLNPALEE